MPSWTLRRTKPTKAGFTSTPPGGLHLGIGVRVVQRCAELSGSGTDVRRASNERNKLPCFRDPRNGRSREDSKRKTTLRRNFSTVSDSEYRDLRQITFVHSSNEMYGADKILLEILQALPENDKNSAFVYLPDDLPRMTDALGDELDKLTIENVVFPLPVLRRRYLRLHGMLPLIRRLWNTFRQFRESQPDIVYCTTSAMVLACPLHAWRASGKLCCTSKKFGRRRNLLSSACWLAMPPTFCVSLGQPATHCPLPSNLARNCLLMLIRSWVVS